MSDADTWGAYLSRNIEDIQEAREAFKTLGSEVSLFQAAIFRELAMLRSTIVADSDADNAEKHEGDAWKEG